MRDYKIKSPVCGEINQAGWPGLQVHPAGLEPERIGARERITAEHYKFLAF